MNLVVSRSRISRDSLSPPRGRAAELYAAVAGAAMPKDIVVSSTSRFERSRNVANTVYWPAARAESSMSVPPEVVPPT